MKIIYACMVLAASGQAAQPAAADPYEPMDLICRKSAHSQMWLGVQQKLQYILGPSAAFVALNREQTLEPYLGSIMEDVASLPKADEAECGTGQLMLSLLKVITIDSDGELIGQIKSKDELSSPILTLLLDVPWTAYQPEWPMFGLLAQAAVKRSQTHTNKDAIDGLLQPELKQMASAMIHAIGESDLENLKALSTTFIDAGASAMEASPIGFLTAIFTQAATAPTKKDAQAMLSDAQILMKSMITSAADLEVTMGSRWPLWGMAYLASLKAADFA